MLVIQRVATHLAHAGTFVENRGKKKKKLNTKEGRSEGVLRGEY